MLPDGHPVGPKYLAYLCTINIRIVVLDDGLLINQLISENDRYRIMLPIVSCSRTVAEVLKRQRFDSVKLTHCGRVTQICVFNTVKLGTPASSP